MKPPVQPNDLVRMKNDAGFLKRNENVRVMGFRPEPNYPVLVESSRPSVYQPGERIRVWVAWREIARVS